MADNYLEKKHQSYLEKKLLWERQKRLDRLKKLCVKKTEKGKKLSV